VTENNEVKEEIKEAVKNSVKERIKYIVQKISNESTKKVIKNLKEELKGKAKEALDETVKNVHEEIEKKLEGSIKKVTEEIVKDNVEKEDILSKIEPFERSLRNSLSKAFPLKGAIIIGAVIILTILGAAVIIPLPSIVPSAPTPTEIPPPTGGWIEGKVFNPDGESMEGVRVYTVYGESSRSNYTNDDGYYKLDNLESDWYGIEAEIEGYDAQRIDEIEVRSGEGVWMDFFTPTHTPKPGERGTKEGALEFSLALVETYFTGDEDKFCSHLADTLYIVGEGAGRITKEEAISIIKEDKPFPFGEDYSEFTIDDYLENYSPKIMDYEEYSKEEWAVFRLFPIDGWTPDADDFLFIGYEVKPGKEGFMWDNLLVFMVTYQNEKWEFIAFSG